MDCNTFTVCARLAMRTLSAWLLKIFKVVPAINASRRLFCWYKKPGLVPGSTSVQMPHSSTNKATLFALSYLSMMAECLITNSSMRKQFFMVLKYSFSSNCLAEPLGGQLLLGNV